MAILSTIRRYERSVPWGVVGALIGVLGIGVGVYLGVFYSRQPLMNIDVLSNAPVLDIRAEVPDLKISYQGISLGGTDRVLRLAAVKFANSGSASILSSLYDPSDPIAIALDSCRVLQQADLLEASNDYLRRRVATAVLDGQQVVTIDPVILDPGDWFTIKLLIFCDSAAPPIITARGKIAGISKLEVADTYRSTAAVSLISGAFGGSLGIQTIRLVAYPVVFILLVSLLAVIAQAPKWVSRRRDQQRVTKLITRESARGLVPEVEWLLLLYRARGIAGLTIIHALLKDPESLRMLATRVAKHKGKVFLPTCPGEDFWNIVSWATIMDTVFQLLQLGWISEQGAVAPNFSDRFQQALHLLGQNHLFAPDAVAAVDITGIVKAVAHDESPYVLHRGYH